MKKTIKFQINKIQPTTIKQSAIKRIESNILKTHLENCVAASFSNKEEAAKKIHEIKNLLDKLQN